MKKNKNFLDKFVKKDYNNELEQVLEEKKFDPHVKSILLEILYKIEMGYTDLTNVKRDIQTKEEYIKDYIEIIKNECDDIKIINMSEKSDEIPENKTYVINKEKKQIISYPIERKLLYAIYKIGNKDSIVKEEHFILNMTLTELINVGYNIDKIEPLRDFNGYSWTTIPHEIESIDHNLVYQILRILAGHQILDKWVKNTEFIIDYYEEFCDVLEQRYGKNYNEIIDIVSQISVLLFAKFNKEHKKELINTKNEIDQKLSLLTDKKAFIEELTKEKLDVNKNIKKIDSILNDKKLLEKEYKERNSNLPLNKKIFSMKVLSKILINEREEAVNKLDELNSSLNPHKFIEYKKSLEKKQNILKILNHYVCHDKNEEKEIISNKDNEKVEEEQSKSNKDNEKVEEEQSKSNKINEKFERDQILNNEEIDKKLGDLKKKLLKTFLKYFSKRTEKVQTKVEIEDLIYEFRYFLLLPYDNEKNVKDIKEIKKQIIDISKKLTNKAVEQKAMTQFSKDEKIDYGILEKFLVSRAISIEDIVNK